MCVCVCVCVCCTEERGKGEISSEKTSFLDYVAFSREYLG